MKWFTATNESSLEADKFFELLAAAVLSVRHNTSLDPHLFYEGSLDHPRIHWLQEHGMSIIPHKLTFRDKITAYFRSEGLNDRKAVHRSGAYLRSELAYVLRERGVEDAFVLYTDCDVLFMADPDFSSNQPAHFAAYGTREGGFTRFHFGGYQHFNSGVMVMNVARMAEHCEDFIDFVLNDGYDIDRPSGRYWNKHLILSDQVAYNLFYRGKIDDLAAIYNWNPANGINADSVIVHFRGLKWNEVDSFLQDNINIPEFKLSKYKRMYRRSNGAYDYYKIYAHDLFEQYDGGI